MSPGTVGGLLGALAAGGLALLITWVLAVRRPPLEARVLPYLRDVASGGAPGGAPGGAAGRAAGAAVGPRTRPGNVAAAVYGPPLRMAAETVERVVGGSASVQRRLTRAGLEITTYDFRVQQVLWGLIGFGGTAAVLLLRALSQPVSPLGGLVLAAPLTVVAYVAVQKLYVRQTLGNPAEVPGEKE